MLGNLAIDPDDLRARLHATIGHGRPVEMTGPDLPYTSRAKKALELAMDESRAFRHSYVGTEHMLLGLLREEKGIAAQVLHEAGVTLETARAETLRILGTLPFDEQLEKTEPVRPRSSVKLRPDVRLDAASTNTHPIGVVVEVHHTGGWILRGELRTIAEAIEFLRAQAQPGERDAR